MHDYGILKREGISIDNSVFNGVGENPYDREFVNSVAKYAKGVTLPVISYRSFIDGIDYTFVKNKFVPIGITNRNPRVLFTANMSKSFLPRYSVDNSGLNTTIKTYDTVPGEELCIIHDNILHVFDYSDITISRTINLDNNMMASYVILKKDNQTIILDESL